MNKPDESWERVERYIANPRDHIVGQRRRSVRLVGYRKGHMFREEVNGRVLTQRDEDDVVRDVMRRLK